MGKYSRRSKCPANSPALYTTEWDGYKILARPRSIGYGEKSYELKLRLLASQQVIVNASPCPCYISIQQAKIFKNLVKPGPGPGPGIFGQTRPRARPRLQKNPNPGPGPGKISTPVDPYL